MITQTPPNLILLLILCLAFLPASQGFASGIGMEQMDSCPGCILDDQTNDQSCNAGNACLQVNCLNSPTTYATVVFSSVEFYLNNSLIIDPGNYPESRFQSLPPGTLYRPPIA